MNDRRQSTADDGPAWSHVANDGLIRVGEESAARHVQLLPPRFDLQARQYYLSLQDGPDVTPKWRKVFESLEDAAFKSDYEVLFKDAQLFPLPGHGKLALTDEVARIESFLTTHSKILDEIYLATASEGYVDLLDFEAMNYSPDVNKLHTAARMLACDAILATHTNDSNLVEAVDRIFRIARLLDNEVLIVVQMTRMGRVQLGLDVVHHSLSDKGNQCRILATKR